MKKLDNIDLTLIPNSVDLTHRTFKVKVDIEMVEDRSQVKSVLDYENTKHHIDDFERRFYIKENKLETEKQYENYILSQMQRASSKINKQRDIEHYRVIADGIKNSTFWDVEKSKNWNMICLGARNEWEGKCFKKLLKVKIKTLDIGLGLNEIGLDYLIDFNLLPEDWDEKWNIVFSNSIDHSENPTFAFFEWLRVLKTDGLMVLGISSEENEESNTDAADCAHLTEESVERFIDGTAKVDLLAKLPSSEKMRYTYYLLQKM